MKNSNKLLSLALEQTRSNVQKTSTRVSMNDRMLKHLLETPMTRIELVNIITLERLEENGHEITEKSFKNDDFLFEFKKMNKTVKNGIDTALSQSNNNSSFFYNKKYKDYQLTEDDNKKYSISKIEVE